MPEHSRPTRNRREWLCDAFNGFGALAFTSMLYQDSLQAANPLTAKPPHETPKAKSVIFLFMAGGPSHIETFDPKPLLNELNGQKRPAHFGEAKYQFVSKDARLMGTKRTFKKYGKSGIDVSDLFPHQAKIVDELAMIRSVHGDMVVHSAAQYQLMTGRIIPGFPSVGSWVIHGLGSESESLPAYCVLPDPRGALEAGQPMYSNGWLPAVYQPTMLRPGKTPVLNLNMPAGVDLEDRRKTLKLIRELNEANQGFTDPEYAARIQSYDTAFRMQTEAPAVFDISKESQETLDLYGVGKQPTDDMGRRCLLARNTTLVVWGGEFGRSPEAEGGKGRDHHNLGFTMWMAGGGIKGGSIVGATDDIGLHAVQEPHHLRDIHTTILHQLGLNQHQLSVLHQGRRERLTELEGNVIKSIV